MHLFQSICFIPYVSHAANKGLVQQKGSLHMTEICVMLSFSLDLGHGVGQRKKYGHSAAAECTYICFRRLKCSSVIPG